MIETVAREQRQGTTTTVDHQEHQRRVGGTTAAAGASSHQGALVQRAADPKQRWLTIFSTRNHLRREHAERDAAEREPYQAEAFETLASCALPSEVSRGWPRKITPKNLTIT